jgi:hypothetical protein
MRCEVEGWGTLHWLMVVLLLFEYAPLHVCAQSPPSGGASPAQTRSRHQYKPLSIDDRVRALAKALDLSEAQKSAVKKVLDNRHNQMVENLRNPSLSSEDRISRVRAINDNTVEQIRATLTEEQKKKYDPMVQGRNPGTAGQSTVEDWMKLMNNGSQ